MNIVGYIFFAIICWSVGLSFIGHQLYGIPIILGIVIILLGVIDQMKEPEEKVEIEE